MQVRIQFISYLTLLTAFVLGCSQDAVHELDTTESLTLYSIDGNDHLPGEEVEKDEYFLGYPVLGKVEIKDPGSRKKIVSALRKGIIDSDGEMNKCFWPRHAIRSSKNGKTTDYIICFECLQLEIHTENAIKTIAITETPQQVFDQQLKNAGIQLAPRAFTE